MIPMQMIPGPAGINGKDGECKCVQEFEELLQRQTRQFEEWKRQMNLFVLDFTQSIVQKLEILEKKSS